MEIIRGQHNIRAAHYGCVVTIGNFDGLHLGHQQILQQVKHYAAKLHLPTQVILFEPQPKEFFAVAPAPARLLRLREKLSLLAELGIDRVLCLRFNQAFAALTAEAFIREILAVRLGVKHLVIGDDFRFGKGRTGDYSLLQRAGSQYGFAVTPTPAVFAEQRRISSSWVREALQQGDFVLAERLLGRPFCLSGKIVRGQQLGRLWGVPTANVLLHRLVCPLSGVFTVQVSGLTAAASLPGVASVGCKPSLGGEKELLEVHLFNFNQTIYGRRIRVEFKQKMREQWVFADHEALKQQIYADIEQAKALLGIGEESGKSI